MSLPQRESANQVPLAVTKHQQPATGAPGRFMFTGSGKATSRLEPIILAAIGIITLSLVFGIRWQWLGDDGVYRDFANPIGQFSGSLTAFLDQRLTYWTSRAIIESAIFLVIRRLFWWRLITALAFWVTIVVPPYLITRQSNLRIRLMLLSALLVLTIPSAVWFSAGYVATSVNYLWPLAAALLAAVPAVLLVQNRKVNPRWYVLATVGAIFAANAEIVAALLAALYVIALAFTFFRNWISRNSAITNINLSEGNCPTKTYPAPASFRIKRNYLVIGAFLLFSIVMLGYHLTSPGNAARRLTNWSFDPLPIIIERSYSSTLRQLFLSGYLLPLAFFAVVAYRNYRTHGLTLFTYLSLIPLAGSLLLRDGLIPGTLGATFQSLFHFGNLLWDPRDAALPLALTPANVFAFTALTVMLITAVIAVITANFSLPKMLVIIALLAAGFVSRFIVANSVGEGLADLFHRTDLYMLIAFLIATLVAVAGNSFEPNPPIGHRNLN